MPVIWLQYTNRESGGRIPVMVEWEWNVLRLKEEITSQLSRTPDTLIFSGREMYNRCKLLDLSISEFSTVYCVLATPNGVSKQEHRAHRTLPSPRRDGYTGIKLPDISVEVDEGYVRMRSQEPHYEHMIPVGIGRDDGKFNFSFRRYLADTNSTQSEHLYETMEQFSSQRGEIKATRIHFSVFCRDVCKDVTQGKLRVRCYDCKSNQFSLSRDPSCWEDVTGGRIGGVCCSCRCDKARAEFYFKCVNHSQQESITTPLKQVNMNDKSVECVICAECPDILMVFECSSLHATCLACFKEYLTVNLVSRQFKYDRRIGYSIGCPAGCPNSLITDTQHFRLLGDELYERMQRFAVEEFVLAEGGVLCPAVGCGEGVLLGSEDRLVTCDTCCHMFCRRCLRRAHFGVCDSSLPVRGRTTRVKLRGNAVRSSWRFGGVGTHGNKGQVNGESDGIKSCPSCNAAVEREGGCAHITCGIGVCGHEWCWLCGKEWNLECREDHWFD